MTEEEYQTSVRRLGEALRQRASRLVDYLASQPAKGEGMHDALEFGWWCVTEGANQASVAIERERRKQVRHGAAQQKEQDNAKDL
jgi:hypothetical protein